MPPAGRKAPPQDEEATVFVASDAVYGCLLARGTPVRLTDQYGNDSTQRGGISLRGPLVAHIDVQPGLPPYGDVFRITVTDLRSAGYGFGAGAFVPSPKATLLTARLKPNGAIAFIYKTGRTKKYVRLKNAYSYRTRLVDSGRRIDAKSLRLRGSTVTWRNAGKRHSARLR